jgi:hypothetical protein
MALEARPTQIQSWFQTWSMLGWFCRSKAAEKK